MFLQGGLFTADGSSEAGRDVRSTRVYRRNLLFFCVAVVRSVMTQGKSGKNCSDNLKV